ncbi:DUF4232 domain-containing protein [Streptomyces sp. NPDC004111]|uniref:DUF4232 domain-containing protein n=1 Tax=Streptomyces sp. NPDC004111 TaxID=3364690 RepID=UPI0036A8DF54
MSARIVRRNRRTRLITLSAVALAATLSLTACENGEGTRDAGPAGTSAPTASQPVSDNKPGGESEPGKGSSSSTGTSTGTGSTGGSGSTSGNSTGKSSGGSNSSGHSSSSGSTGGKDQSASDPTDPKNRAVCDSSNIKVTAQVVQRPINTMILTATNTGSKLCDLYFSPAVQFENAQSVPPTMEESKPQAVTSLMPGEKGYAAVKLSKGDEKDENGYTAKSLKVNFYDRSNNGLDGSVDVRIPAKGVYIDSSIRVSYWQSDLDGVSSL